MREKLLSRRSSPPSVCRRGKPVCCGWKVSGWTWVPTLYFAEGLPYVAVMTMAVILYKRLGLGNAEIALYTSWLYLPWTVKPLWSPFVDLLRTKRWWVISMQGLLAVALAGVAFFIPTVFAVKASLACFWLMAFASATHDIAADGYYLLCLTPGEQSLFIGIRNTFYRLANIFGQGLLVMLAGWLEQTRGSTALAWSLTFYAMAGLFLALTIYHRFILPHPSDDGPRRTRSFRSILRSFGATFTSYFLQDKAPLLLFFLLTYRLGEAQLAKLTSPFLLDGPLQGGLGLSTSTVGVVYGTVGVVALLLGGILGGWLVSVHGFRRWILPMALAINLPDLLYVWLASALPAQAWVVALCVAVEQFGYGFGFTAYTLCLILMADGPYKTAHYALGTGIMAIGMMLPGMFAGMIQEATGYPVFFLWVFLCTLPGLVATLLVRRTLDPGFGRHSR